MTPSKFNHGYTAYRGYGSMTHICAVREGALPPSKYPIPAFVKTSYIYVTYVTPVTGLKVFVCGLDWVSEVDCSLGEYGIRRPQVVICSACEGRRNGVGSRSSFLRAYSPIYLVTNRSSLKVNSARVNNCAELSRNFFLVSP